MITDSPELVESLVQATQKRWRLFLVWMLTGAALAVLVVSTLPETYQFRTVISVGTRMNGEVAGPAESPDAVVSRLVSIHLPQVRLAIGEGWAAKYPLLVHSPRGSAIVELASTGTLGQADRILGLHRSCAERALSERRDADASERAVVATQLTALEKQTANAKLLEGQLDRRQAVLFGSASRSEIELTQLSVKAEGIEQRRQNAAAGTQGAIALAAQSTEAERLYERMRFYEARIFEQIPAALLEVERERQTLDQDGIARELRRAVVLRTQTALDGMKTVFGPMRKTEPLGMGMGFAAFAGMCGGILVVVAWLNVSQALAKIRHRQAALAA